MKTKNLKNLLNRAAAALTDAGDLTKQDISCLLKDLHVAADTMAEEDGAIARHQSTAKMPRVLIVVSGGVADFESDAGIDVEIFDRDNYEDNPEDCDGVPFHFADLAEPIGVAVATEEKAVILEPLALNVIELTLVGSKPPQAVELTGTQLVIPDVAVEPVLMEIFPGATQEEIGSFLMSDIVGGYDTPDQVPEWAWVERTACYGHARNGQDGIWEFVINLSSSLIDIPEKLKSMFAEARSKNLAYVIVHQGT